MKKGQSAIIEFLVTYGWAFLVIIIMIAALFYFGILNPANKTNSTNTTQPINSFDTTYGVLNCNNYDVGSCGVYLTGCSDNATYMCLSDVKKIK